MARRGARAQPTWPCRSCSFKREQEAARRDVEGHAFTTATLVLAASCDVTGNFQPEPEPGGASSRPFAGVPGEPRAPIGTACVLGGSFAGLLAARVLADHAERVIILERDVLTRELDVRPSVPQGRHGHLLQPEGLSMIEGWFPGFTQEARARGAVLAPPGHQSLFTDGVAVEYPPSTMLMASRPFLESEIRRRVRAITNIRIVRAQATGLRYGAGAVRGVVYRARDADGWGAQRTLDVDIAVDAMGRGSRLRSWLSEYGFSAPVVQRVRVGVGYVTALFSRPGGPHEPNIPCALDQFNSQPPTDRPRVGGGNAAIAVYAIEGRQWQVVAMSHEHNQAETTAEDLRELCADLPEVFREATSGDAVDEVATFYYRESLRRSVTDLERYPAGLVSIGDSVASFNPVRGQGLVSAAKQVSVLAAHLAANDEPAAQSRDFIRRVDKVIDDIWENAAGP
jgi:2-polyprenyl-6-methoxyphenol hydroxylase-like FAD-dependent oxidoreductase